MRKWFAVAAMMVAPLTAEAQDYSLETYITEVTGTGFTGGLRIRNTQAYTPGSVFSILGVQVTSSLGIHGDGGTVGRVGNVYVEPLGGTNGGIVIPFSRFTFGAVSGIGNHLYIGTLDNPAPGELGILGCSVPIVPAGNDRVHAGRTCTAAGETGAYEFTFRFLFLGPPRTDPVTVNDLQFRVNARYETMFQTTSATVPEPSTYALMAAGLAGIGLVARRRQRV